MHRKIIDEELIERYELFLDLKDEMDKIYHYTWHVPQWNGTTVLWQSTNKLSVILDKLQQHLIDRVQITEENKNT